MSTASAAMARRRLMRGGRRARVARRHVLLPLFARCSAGAYIHAATLPPMFTLFFVAATVCLCPSVR